MCSLNFQIISNAVKQPHLVACVCVCVCVYLRSFPGGSDGKESACQARDPGLIPASGRSSGGGHGNSFQYACLGSSMGRGAWQATVHGDAKSWTQLSNYTTVLTQL